MNMLDRLMDEAPGWEAPAERVAIPAPYAEPQFAERCPKCDGTGRFRHLGPCYTCKGKGQRYFKTDAATRQRARERVHANHAAKIEGWVRTYPNEMAWINAKRATFGFAAAMAEAVARYGELTDKQLATVQRLMAADAERAATRETERQAREAAAATVSVEALETAFAVARDNGIRYPKLPLTWVENPANPKEGAAQTFLFKTSVKGPVYVTERNEYLGKITGGRFFPVRACDAETQGRILAVCADPKQAAVAYGRRFGACCKCGRELTNPASIEAGIGPICAEKYGW